MSSSWWESAGGDVSMGALVMAAASALSKLATSSKKPLHKQIRAECQAVAQHIIAVNQRNQQLQRDGLGATVVVDCDADKYFLMLKLACDTGVSKLMCVALDVMQKLVAYGYLTGTSIADPRIYADPNPHRAKQQQQQQSTDGATASVPTQLADAAVTNKSAQAAGQLLAETHTVLPEPHSDELAASHAADVVPSPSPTSSSSSSLSDSDLTLASLSSQSPSALLAAGGSDGKMIAVMIDTLYQASQYKDAAVQLLVLKCVLTCITSASVGVHGWTLLQTVATCYQIYLQNPSHANSAAEEVNRVTAKATLTQIANLVFQRMEHCALQLRQIHTAQQQQQQAAMAQEQQEQGEHDKATTASSLSVNAADISVSVSPMTSPSPDARKDSSDVNGSSSSAGVVDPLQSPLSSAPSTSLPPAAGRRGFCTWCSRPANHYCLQTKDSVCSLECKLANLRAKDPEEKLTLALKRKIILQLELCQNDAHYLLRALCKLAIKMLPASAGTDNKDPASLIAVDSKVLSLQLLLSILSNAGPTFRTTKHFLATVRGDLVTCLLRNSAASSIETIFALSSSLFVALVCHFKPHLHAVIGPVLGSIYLPYIASPNSTFEHKYISLTVLHKLCLDPQTLIELFVNYDSDEDALGNTFQMMASTLERVCRSRLVSDNWLSALEEARLRLLALEGLVDTIKSLLTWTKRAQANLIAHKEAADAAAAAAAAAALASAGANGDGRTSGYDSDEESGKTGPGAGAGPSHHHARQMSVATPLATPSADKDSNRLQQFHALRAQRQKLDTGILKFNMKPKKGLAYLSSHGLLQSDSPLAVAQFFLANAHALDKVQVGEFMGDENEFNKAVLYAYVEQLDFRGLSFDNAIRTFLNGFWLPGEAQKIDRMMEKFAEQFHKHNPGHFSSADTAYVLAYSVIMLNVDAHSPMVKVRMTKEDFMRNARGIDDGKDIDPAFMGQIYDGIVKNEIKMKDDTTQRGGAGAGGGGGILGREMKRGDRLASFISESEGLVAKVDSYLETYHRKHEQQLRAQEGGGGSGSGGGVSGSSGVASDSLSSSSTDPAKRRLSMEMEESKVFYQASDFDVEAVRPMFEILWYPCLATFSVLLEESDAKSGDEAAAAAAAGAGTHGSGAGSTSSNASHQFRMVELCLDGYRHSIRLSSALGLETSRLAFVTSLRKFTLLGSTRELHAKNLEAIKMLLHISHTEGNYLKESWIDVLQVISELERLHLFAAGSRPIADVFQSSPMRTRESDSINSMHINKIDASSIDRVFTGSAHLDSEAIVDFVKALRLVSEQELSSSSAPRVFSLQKLVEITYYNMGRIRVVWSRIWSVLSPYFIKAGTHPNLNVSMYAIDSLRQLAMKFLEKDELANYQFQKQFFRPFELIMQHNANHGTRELIVECMFKAVQSRVHNIKSGWRGVFVVIQTGAASSFQPLVAASFALLCNILDHHFELLTSTTDTMDEMVNSLVTFGCCAFTETALKALGYLNMCADHLGAQQLLRRDRMAQKGTASGNGNGSDTTTTGAWASDSSTPQRSRGASTTTTALNTDSLSVSTASLPATPIAAPTSVELDPEAEQQLSLLSPSSGSGGIGGGGDPHMQQELKIWFLALTGLSRMVGDSRVEVRTRALVTLFKILHKHGALFSQSTWRAIFHGVLFPIFDDVRHSSDPAGRGASTGPRKIGGAPFADQNTPVSDSITPAAAGQQHAHHGHGAWSRAGHAPGAWRNLNHWVWPASGQPTIKQQQMASSPVVNGIGNVTSAVAPAGAGVATPAPGNATPTQRTIPTLPPKPPSMQQAGAPRMLPSMPPPAVPTSAAAATARQQQQQPGQSGVSRPSGPSAGAAPAETSWLSTTCLSALSTLVELFDHFYSSVSFMLSDVLQLINSCIVQESQEDLSRIGIKCLGMLLQRCGPKLSTAAWWVGLESMAEVVQRTMPVELMSPRLRAALGLPEETATQTHGEGDRDDSTSRASSRAPSRKNSAAAMPAHVQVASQPAAAPADGPTAATEPASTTAVALSVNVNAPSGLSTPSSVSSPAMPFPATTPQQQQQQQAQHFSSLPPSPSRPLQVTVSPSPSPLPATPSSGGVPSSVLLPLNSGATVTKFKVQLWLLDALFLIIDTFFPKKEIEQQRSGSGSGAVDAPGAKSPRAEEKAAGEELDFGGNDGESSESTSPSASAAASASVVDDSVLGCLTCEQLFFGLDLLSSVLHFSRAFNSNVMLRRRLYAVGFQTEQTLQGRLPQLFLQETRATRLYVHLLFRLIREGAAGETAQAEKSASMDGDAWIKLQAEQQQQQSQSSSLREDDRSLSDLLLSSSGSYSSSLSLVERRVVSLSLRFLADYVSKSVSGQLVSLEFSEELLCSFVDNLHRVAAVSPQRFNNYLSIFYQPLMQLVAFGNAPIRQHLALLLQHALPPLLPFTTIVPFPLHKINAPIVPVPAAGQQQQQAPAHPATNGSTD